MNGAQDGADPPRLPGTLVVSGGVAANQELRRRLQALCDATPAPGGDGAPWRLLVPPPRLCTDNGVMVAWAAIEALNEGRSHEAEGQGVRARWPLGRLAENAEVPKGTKSARSDLRKGIAV
jgi:N6-L-threonylcarbamoyladenine synthase